ncbi:MAG: putative peptidoglycan glycosyltransferase FtsW [Thalassobaculales bacterium]
MSIAARLDNSILGRWWWTVDRWALVGIGLLIAFGALLIVAASPAVAERINLDPLYFVRRHFVMLPLCLALMLGLSLLPPVAVRRLALFGLLGAIGLLVVVLLAGAEIKGARRWISLAGVSIQPSEFAKPFFAVVAAALFAAWRTEPRFPGQVLASLVYGLLLALLLLQPDVGQAFVLSAIWFAQFFVAGLPLVLVGIAFAAGVAGAFAAYFTLGHFRARVDKFLDPDAGDSYQIEKSMEAFLNGGLYGRGPGEGTVKAYIPDSHADFIFAVAGEELGLLACLMIVALFAFVVLRSLGRLIHEQNLFVLLAGTGLIVQFGLQAAINMASTLHLIPTKGMTLPFISYGGSSLLAMGITTGMLLALTRRRPGEIARVGGAAL